MFDFIFDNYIFLIALAVFIGRFILQAKAGRQNRNQRYGSPGRKETEAPRLPEEVPLPIMPAPFPREASLVVRSAPKAPQRPVLSKERKPESTLASPPPEPGSAAPLPSGAGAEGAVRSFGERLDSLSPLRRAVVMAEVLGPPKGA